MEGKSEKEAGKKRDFHDFLTNKVYRLTSRIFMTIKKHLDTGKKKPCVVETYVVIIYVHGYMSKEKNF
jgi:hypothetical protein